jgi:hypothetical protein
MTGWMDRGTTSWMTNWPSGWMDDGLHGFKGGFRRDGWDVRTGRLQGKLDVRTGRSQGKLLSSFTICNIYILGENRTGSLIELKSGFQSSLYHLLVLLT